MLRLKLLNRCNNRQLTSYRNYLSNEYKTVMSNGFDVQHYIQGSDKQGNSLVNGFITDKNCKLEVCDQHLQLRTRKEAFGAFESNNYGIIRHFLDSDNIDDLIDVLSDRLYYGVFLDDFTACYLLDMLLKEQDLDSAKQIAIQLKAQENLEHPLVVALSMKVCYEYLRKQLLENVTTTTTEAVATEEKAEEKPTEKDSPLNPLLGKTLLQIAKQLKLNEKKCNIKAMGHLLCDQHKDFIALLSSGGNVFYKDILKICIALIKDKENIPPELKDTLNTKIESSQLKENFADLCNSHLKECLQTEESALIENQKSKFQTWVRDREIILDADRKKLEQEERIAHARKTFKEIEEQQQLLWFFELEDKLDLDIYSKKKMYPKRWFGKKKKPKAIDDDYIPPEATKKYNV